MICLLYVTSQPRHANPTATLKHYAKWTPKGEQQFVNALDDLGSGEPGKGLGTKNWHQFDITEVGGD